MMAGAAIDAASVARALEAASSQQQHVVKQAEQQLSQWRHLAGFFASLACLAADSSGRVPLAVRWQALLYLKNHVDIHWRLRPLGTANSTASTGAVAGASTTDPIVVAECERAEVRRLLLQCYADECWRLAVQVAAVIGRVARHDWPRHWPQLVPQLLETVAQVAAAAAATAPAVASPQLTPLPPPLLVQRSLLALYQVVSALCTRRLPADRRLFHQLSAQVAPVLLAAWRHWTSEPLLADTLGPLLSAPASSATAATATSSALQLAVLTVQSARLFVKLLRRIAVHGLPDSRVSATNATATATSGATAAAAAAVDFASLLPLALPRSRSALLCRHQLATAATVAEAGPAQLLLTELDKYGACHLKLLLDLVDNQPQLVAPQLSDTLLLCAQLLFSHQCQSMLLCERVSHLCLTLLTNIVGCDNWRGTSSSCQPHEVSSAAADDDDASRTVDQFFDDQLLRQLLEQLVTRYLQLTDSDLVAWRVEPEAFFFGDTVTCRFNVAAAAESLFAALMRRYRSRLAPLLVALMNHTLTTIPATATASRSLLEREAVYNLVGQAAYELYEQVDFDSWLCSSLLHEAGAAEPDTTPASGDDGAGDGGDDGLVRVVLQRRVVWLIGRWLGVRLSHQLRPTVYTALATLLQPHRDLVLRLTAAQTLKDAVDDFEFRPDDMTPPLVATVLRLLFRLLTVDVHECQSKMFVLNAMSFVMERVDAAAVAPHCGCQLVDCLAQLWREAGGSDQLSMLRVVVVTAATQLLRTLSAPCSGTPTAAAVALRPLLFDMVTTGVDLARPPHVYLLEDCLTLWRTLVELADTLQPDLLQLYGHMLPVLELGSDSLECGLLITQAYLLLEPAAVLAQYGQRLAAVCAEFVDDGSSSGGGGGGGDWQRELGVALWRTVELAVRAHCDAAMATLGPLLLCSARLLLLPPATTAMSAATGGSSSGQRAVVAAVLLSVLARVVLQRPAVFEQLLTAVAAADDGGSGGGGGSRSVAAVFTGLLDVWLDTMHSMWQVERRKLCALALCSLLTASPAAVIIGHRSSAICRALAETLHDVTQPESLTDALLWRPEDADTDLAGATESPHDRRRCRLMAHDPEHTLSLSETVADTFRRLHTALGDQHYRQLINSVDTDARASLEHYLPLLP